MPKITIKEIAARAGMSVPTVSRILNRKKGFQVKEETRERVFALAEEMGYQPNLAARSLRSGKRFAIGVAGTGDLGGMKDMHAALIYSGIGQVAEEHGYFLSFFPQGQDFAGDLVRAARNNMVDGLVIINYPRHYDEFRQRAETQLRGEDIPFVVVHNTDMPYDCPNVGFNHTAAGAMATEYLLEKGFRCIRLLGYRDPFTAGFAEGCRAVLMDAGLQLRETYFEGSSCQANIGYGWGEQMIAGKHDDDAYLVPHDFLAAGVQVALQSHGITDRGMVASGGLYEDGQVAVPRIPTVTQFPVERGMRATQMLFAAINKETVADGPGQIFLPELIEHNG